MGGGILPTTIHNGKLYFLFGKENKFADTPGWSDFGGGTENGESYLTTAIREAGEELTGFLGSTQEINKMLTKHGTYNIDNANYRMHLFPMHYNEALPHYYNNNQQFLQKHLDENVIKKTKIFEKAEIKWIPANDLLLLKKQFSSYFQDIVELLVQQQAQIQTFMEKSLGKSKKINNNNNNNIYKMEASMSSKKGTRSKTHPGRKNYTTKRGDKVFHRKGKYVRMSRRPYMKGGRRKTRRKH